MLFLISAYNKVRIAEGFPISIFLFYIGTFCVKMLSSGGIVFGGSGVLGVPGGKEFPEVLIWGMSFCGKLY